MGRLVVVLTSPRLPGLLTPAAWRLLTAADVVAAADPAMPLARAVGESGIDVRPIPEATADALLGLAETRDVVWLTGDEGDETLTQTLAHRVVGRSEAGAVGPEVEVVAGAYDPVGARLLDAVAVMDTLRRRCPWDREQTHESLVPYLVEETYEVIEAIESEPGSLQEELGDLLLQVLFHARVAAEQESDGFTIDDVAATLVDKLVRRHPHVFGDTEVSGPADVQTNWEEIKRVEKGRRSVVEGIPAGMPALSLADSLVSRALRADARLTVPQPPGPTGYTEETLGEVLFALVAAARADGLDAERALRARVRVEMAALRDAEQAAERPDALG